MNTGAIRQPISQKVLASLALLKAFSDEGKSYVDLFVPFVVECIPPSSPNNAITIPDLCVTVQSMFGIVIPAAAMKSILRRAEKRHLILRNGDTIFRNNTSPAISNLKIRRADAEREMHALANRLAAYAQQSHQLDWSPEQSSDALLNFLSIHAVDVLAAVAGHPIVAGTSALSPQEGYIVASFISQVCKDDPTAYEWLKIAVRGRMLADVLVYSNLDTVSQRFDNLACFLDTPVILGAIGLNGPELQTSDRQTLDLLYQQNAIFRIFEHTREEIHGVLAAAEYALRRGDLFRGPASPFFIREHIRPSTIALISATLDKRLEALHVRVVPKPAFERDYTLDEVNFSQFMRQRVRYKTDEQLRHDYDCIEAIYRIRRSDRPIRLEFAKAMFLTKNIALARASAEYFERTHGYTFANIPVCFIFDALGTLAWVKNPAHSSELPYLRLAADCIAALNPSERLWDQVLEEARRLSEEGQLTNDDLALLRDSSEARIAIMGVTKGDPEAAVSETIMEAVTVVKRNIRADVEEKLRKEEGRRISSEQDYQELKRKYDTELAIRQQEYEQRKERVLEVSRSIAHPIASGLGIVVWIVLAVGTVWGLFREQLRSFSINLILMIFVAIALLWSLWSFRYGTSLRYLERKSEMWISNKIYNMLLKQLINNPHNNNGT